MAQSPDHYAVLEVAPGAAAAAIKAAYRKLAKQFHPDVNESAEARLRMRQINQAWETLGDPLRRAEFDRTRPKAPPPPRPRRQQQPGPRAGAARPRPASRFDPGWRTEDAPREASARPEIRFTGDPQVDWYALLGVRPDAARVDIVKALGRLTAEMGTAATTATEVARRKEKYREAWAILGDPHMRAAYDRARKEAREDAFANPGAAPEAPPEPAGPVPGQRIGPFTVNGLVVDAGLDLRQADLRGAALRGYGLAGIDLRGALLQGADFEGASLRRAKLGGADLSGANLRWADLGHADLAGATLRQADLAHAALHATGFVRANLAGASLAGAVGPGINLDFADLTRADLTGARITVQLIERAKHQGAIFPDGSVPKPA